MPAATKKLRAPAELEASEPKAHEAGESPEDDVREGSEDAPRPSRKRGAKNAKRTKAPMDSEGCGGSCGCTSCSKRKRSDSLTPQEYLTACELGIEQRSRSYIRARLDTAMALTPSTIRADLKCGNGSISEGEKCTKGAAQRVQTPQQKPRLKGGSKVRGLKTAAKIAGAAALIGGAAYMQQTARRNILERRSLANPASAAGAAFRAHAIKHNMSSKSIRNLRERATLNAIARRATKRDSIWAEGFQP